MNLASAGLRETAAEIERLAGFLMQRDGCDPVLALDRAARLVLQERSHQRQVEGWPDEPPTEVSEPSRG